MSYQGKATIWQGKDLVKRTSEIECLALEGLYHRDISKRMGISESIVQDTVRVLEKAGRLPIGRKKYVSTSKIDWVAARPVWDDSSLTLGEAAARIGCSGRYIRHRLGRRPIYAGLSAEMRGLMECKVELRSEIEETRNRLKQQRLNLRDVDTAIVAAKACDRKPTLMSEPAPVASVPELVTEPTRLLSVTPPGGQQIVHKLKSGGFSMWAMRAPDPLREARMRQSAIRSIGKL